VVRNDSDSFDDDSKMLVNVKIITAVYVGKGPLFEQKATAVL
jgi:hypothetical protein